MVVTLPKLADVQEKLDAMTPPAAPSKPVTGSGSASVDRYGALYALAEKSKSPPTPTPTAPPTQLAGGSAVVTLDISRNNAGQMVISPVVDAKDMTLSKDGILDPLGAIAARGLITVAAVPADSISPSSANDTSRHATFHRPLNRRPDRVNPNCTSFHRSGWQRLYHQWHDL